MSAYGACLTDDIGLLVEALNRTRPGRFMSAWVHARKTGGEGGESLAHDAENSNREACRGYDDRLFKDCQSVITTSSAALVKDGSAGGERASAKCRDTLRTRNDAQRDISIRFSMLRVCPDSLRKTASFLAHIRRKGRPQSPRHRANKSRFAQMLSCRTLTVCGLP